MTREELEEQYGLTFTANRSIGLTLTFGFPGAEYIPTIEFKWFERLLGYKPSHEFHYGFMRDCACIKCNIKTDPFEEDSMIYDYIFYFTKLKGIAIALKFGEKQKVTMYIRSGMPSYTIAEFEL